MIKKKILAIVYRIKNHNEQFLALLENSSEIDQSVGYYVVTGGVEGNEGLLDAVKREIMEETGIENIVNILDLNKIYEYKHPAEGDYLCQESCFAVEVDDEVKHLSVEHTGYKWLPRKEFSDTIFWYTNKADLDELLNKFIKHMSR
ncbi:MAG: NUDIX domain-containing protein [bacterium]|nr:NUDIX domain-containing protein [bacterium]